MPSAMNIVAFDSWMRDMYAGPGAQLKQWVVDTRRTLAWERDTCPLVLTDTHNDNTGIECRNSGATRWNLLDHDCCGECNDLQDATRGRADVVAWLVARERYMAEHPICTDRDKFSDQIEPEWPSLRDHPFLKAIKATTKET